MKKSSLGRRSSAATSMSRKTSDFTDRGNRTGIPLPTSRRRDTSGERMSDYGSVHGVSGTQRTPRQLTMSTGRMSSLGGTKKIDPRPVLEREWQLNAVENLLTALSLDQEGCAILQSCNRNLKPLSLTNFINIAQYFVRQLDSTMKLDQSNFTAEIPFILKRLQYKGKVDKSVLQTVNTMHNWPHAIAILHFLFGLVQSSNDFMALGLAPLYPDSLEQESTAEDELDFKLFLPLFHDLWDQACMKNDWNCENLISLNNNGITQLCAQSGFSNDIFSLKDKTMLTWNNVNKEFLEVSEKYNRLESQFKSLTDKKKALQEENNQEKEELECLQLQNKEEENRMVDLEKEINYIVGDCKVQEGILASYEADDNQVLSLEEYKQYEKEKETLKENIRYEQEILYRNHENLMDSTMKTSTIKNECESLFKNYNAFISETVMVDASVRGAICHARPKLGTTPCNDATARLLERTLQSYEETLANLESQINKPFELGEEYKSKMGMLDKIKQENHDLLSENEQKKAGLEKILSKVDKENEEICLEIVALEESLKQEDYEYEEVETLLKHNEEKLKKYHDICQTKLNVKHECILELDCKMKAKLEEILSTAKVTRDQLKNMKE